MVSPESGNLLEVLESGEVVFLDFWSFELAHATHQSIMLRWAQEESWREAKKSFVAHSKASAEQD
jgi:hypothetical protein